MTLAELREELKATSKRTDITDAQLNSFIRMAHAELSVIDTPDSLTEQVMDPQLWVNVVNNIWAQPLPERTQRVRYVYVNGVAIQSMDEGHLRSQFARQFAAPAKGYAIQGINLLVAPGTGDDIRISYSQRLVTPSADADTNWLLDQFPDCYLYQALIHLYQFVQETEQMQLCEALAGAARGPATIHAAALMHGSIPRIRSA